MATIIVVHDDVTSKTLMLVELARRLRRAGHSVSLMSFVPRPEGLGDFEHRQHRLRYTADMAAGSRLERLRGLLHPTPRRQAVVEQFEVAAFNESVADLRPDLLLIDIECHEFVVAAQALGLPVATVAHFSCMWKRPGCPPLHFKAIPGRGFLGSRLGIELCWQYFRVRKLAQRWRGYLRRGGADRDSVLTHFAAARAPSLRPDRSQWLIPFIYRDLPLLSTALPELDWPHEPPPNVLEGGPILRPPGSPEDTASRLGAAGPFLDRSRAAGRPVVYCAFGAYAGDLSLWRRLVTVATDHAEWDFVFGLGARIPQETLGPLSPNVLALGWAPQPEVLSRADCAVVHSGPFTLNECFFSAVPVLMYPFDMNDQWGMAARAEANGVGVIGDRDHDTPAQIGRRIESLLTNTGVAARLKAIRDRLARYHESDQAVRVVGELLEGRSP